MDTIRTPTIRKAVLVVDDEPILRMLASEYANDAGLNAIEAASADEALAVLKQHDDICLVFTDVQMPGSMNGLELAAIIGKRWPGMAIIVTSGRVRPDAADLPPNAAFLPKPYSCSSLMPALHRAADRC